MLPRAVRNAICSLSAAFVAAILLLPAVTHAQALFQPLTAVNTKSITLSAGNTPFGVASADFNHDGYPDMVVANYKANTISVYMASGAGTFAAPVTYPTCGGPTAVLAKDLDISGSPDIVITCNTPSSNVIEVFLNLGNGTFNPVPDGITNIVLGTGKGPVSIVSGDFNNDGHLDLAVANTDGTVTLFLSNAANNFTYYIVKTLTGFGALTGITDGRFSTSGNLDLAITDSTSRSVHILNGDGTGNFATGASVAVGKNPTGIVSGDFNHDGYADLAVVNSGSGKISILLGKGSGNFSGATFVSVGPASGTGASAIIAADISGNGTIDLLTANTLQNTVAVLVGNGNGTFQAVQDYAVPNGPAYLAVGDFNRDGKPDLAVSQSTGASVSVLINNTLPTPISGGRNFLAPTNLTNGRGNMADGIAVGDFRHSGYTDLAVTYLEDNSVRVLRGRGGNKFSAAAVYPVGQQPYAISTGDLNNDGYLDLVTANTSLNSAAGTVSVLMNNGGGTGTFAAAQNLQVGRLPYGVAIGDLNGDGIPDLAVTDYGDNAVTILYGPFNTGFQIVQLLPTCVNPYGVAIADFRHTGQNDIAVTCYQSAQMEVFLNNGMLPYSQTPPPTQTTFQTPEILTTGMNPTSLVVGDFNRDGRLDIVTGNSTANNVSFFAGNGDGTFKAAVNSFALNFPDSIAAGDINGDGILDLAAVAPNFNQATVLIGNGDGTFEPRADFPTGPQPWAVALADLNYSGKMSIVTANTFNRVNLAVPAYQAMYMKEFPPVTGGNPSLSVLLNSSGTTITVTAAPTGTIAYNTPVTLTARVAPALGGTTPTGSVIFEDNNGTPSAPVPLTGGVAMLTITNLGSGTHRFTVLYSGDALYQPNTVVSRSSIKVTGTPVSLTLAQNPITPTTVVAYTVTIGTAKPAARNPVGTITVYVKLPNGTIQVADGPNAVGTAGKGGVTTFSKTLVAGVPPGNYYAYAVFTPAPGSTYGAGSSPQILVISQ